MNELPVIRSLCLHTDFWDRHGKHCKSLEGNVRRTFVSKSKRDDFSERFLVFAALLSEMDLGNADTREAQVFV